MIERVLGEIKHSGEKLRLVEKPHPASWAANLKRYAGGSVYWSIEDLSGKMIGCYAPSGDILQVYLATKGNERVRLMKAVRKILPELLKREGYVDAEGKRIPDGNEAFRVKFYEAWCYGEDRDKGASTTFKMPSNPYGGEEAEDEPFTWPEGEIREEALHVKFRLMYEEVEVYDAEHHDTPSEQKYHAEQVKKLRAELSRLYASSKVEETC